MNDRPVAWRVVGQAEASEAAFRSSGGRQGLAASGRTAPDGQTPRSGRRGPSPLIPVASDNASALSSALDHGDHVLLDDEQALRRTLRDIGRAARAGIASTAG